MALRRCGACGAPRMFQAAKNKHMAQTNDFRIETCVIWDTGADGVFWRKGERWLREHGRESRLLDIAPNLEAAHMLNLDVHERKAKELSEKS